MCLVNWLRRVSLFLNWKCCAHLQKVRHVNVQERIQCEKYKKCLCVRARYFYIHSSMHLFFSAEINVFPFQSHVKQNEKQSFSFCLSFSLFIARISKSNRNTMLLCSRNRHRFMQSFSFSPSTFTETDRCARLFKFIICSLCFLMSFRFSHSNPFHFPSRSYFATCEAVAELLIAANNNKL